MENVKAQADCLSYFELTGQPPKRKKKHIPMPDSYVSANLHRSISKAMLRSIYGNDVDTQPPCRQCGRPMYYRLNIRNGLSELFCIRCSENEQGGVVE